MARLVNQLQPTTESNYVSLDVPIGTAGDLGTIITIGSEQMLVRDGLGTTGLDVERGVNGTTIASHQVGTTVTLTRTAAVMYQATLNLTEAEFSAAGTAPITIIPAPGAGKIVVFTGYAHRTVITDSFVDSPYFAYGDYNTTGAYANLRADDSGGSLANATGTVSHSAIPYFVSTITDYDYENLPVVFQRDSGGGTATSTITAFYTIADLS